MDLGAVAKPEQQVSKALEEYRFNDAANAIYQFTWHSFCDWYLEFTKPILSGEDELLALKRGPRWVGFLIKSFCCSIP